MSEKFWEDIDSEKSRVLLAKIVNDIEMTWKGVQWNATFTGGDRFLELSAPTKLTEWIRILCVFDDLEKKKENVSILVIIELSEPNKKKVASKIARKNFRIKKYENERDLSADALLISRWINVELSKLNFLKPYF